MELNILKTARNDKTVDFMIPKNVLRTTVNNLQEAIAFIKGKR